MVRTNFEIGPKFGGSTTLPTYNIQYDENTLTNKAYYVCQGMVAAQRYALTNGASDCINVVYPYPKDGQIGSTVSFCLPNLALLAIVESNWNLN